MAGVDLVGMAQRVLEHHDLTYEVKRGKHVKIVVRHQDRKHTLVCGGSTSDKRALMNFFSTIRAVLIRLGVDFKLDSKALIYN
jgi:hypothetical protein